MLSEYCGKIKQNVSSKTARVSYLVFGGNILTQGLAFLVSVLVARALGPADYGTFAVAYIFMIFSTDIVDFGLEKSFVRHYSSYSVNDPAKADHLFKSLFCLKLFVGALLCLVIFFSSGFLAKTLFHSQSLIVPIKLAGIGLIGGALLRFETSFFQANEQFNKYIWVNLAHSALRMCGVLVLTYFSLISLNNLMGMYVMVYLIGFAFASLLLPRFSLELPKSKESFAEIFKMSKWIFISTILAIIETRLDFFMLGHFSAQEEVGYFSAAWNIASILPLLIGAACTALFPKVSRMLSQGELKSYVNKLLSFSPLIIPVIISAVLLSRWAILLIYGREYSLGVGPLQILCMGYSLILLIVPISLVLYSLDKAWVLALINLLELVSHGTANWFLIPSHGALGAALANLLVKIITTAGTLGFVYFLLKKPSGRAETEKSYGEVVKV